MAITFRIAKDLLLVQFPYLGVLKLSIDLRILSKQIGIRTLSIAKWTANKRATMKVSHKKAKIFIQSCFEKKKSIQGIIKEIEEVCEKMTSYCCVHRYLRFLDAKPFHQVPSPLISIENVDDRLWFVNYLSKWDIEDLMHLASSDEFFIFKSNRSNYQNDRIWAIDNDDFTENVKVKQSSKHPSCIGIFFLFTVKKMLWLVKDQG